MKTEEAITLRRDCDAVMIPSGERVRLSGGSTVWVVQMLGSGYKVMTDKGYTVRVDARDADAMGMPLRINAEATESGTAGDWRDLNTKIWDQLKSCFDPEIPVNIVDLGLIYGCQVTPLGAKEHRVDVRFTLTAQGCGMGEILKGDIERKLLALPGVREVNVQLVWDPPWNQSMISESAKQELGIA